MAAIPEERLAPDFALPTMDGTEFSLRASLNDGPVILAFFKISCPVCQYAFPYLERMHQALKERGVKIVGVSQDDRRHTAEFTRAFGITFPIVLDDTDRYDVSNAYGLTNVPTVFDIDEEGVIQTTSVGWSRADLEAIYRRHADGSELANPLFKPAEKIADFKGG